MGEELLTKPNDNHRVANTPVKSRRKRPRVAHEYEEDPDTIHLKKEIKINGALLAVNRPSYCLRRGIGSLQCSGESLRSQHRKKLLRLAKKLIRSHNWNELGGVLSVLLQGTGKDLSPARNRFKYWAALELLNYIKDGNIGSRKIQNVFDLWMKKTGPLKNWSEKNRFAVQVEFTLFCLQHGSKDQAHQAALCLMQERGFHNDPVSNLVVGLVFYQLWYLSIPKELQLSELDLSDTFRQWEFPVVGICMTVNNSMENDAHDDGVSKSLMKIDSNTSVANGKGLFEDNSSLRKGESMETNDNMRKKTCISIPNLHPQSFYIYSAGESGGMDYSDSHDSGSHPRASIFYGQGLPSWLLPLKLPNFHENFDDAMQLREKLHNDLYKNAVKHLRVALRLESPVMEAFQPLVQLLLLGDQVKEALGEVENLTHSSTSVVQLRIKAELVKNFDGENYAKLCLCLEDILKKDPTCRDSLGKLISLHHRGDYNLQNLVEMIALHLDAVNGTCDVWKELASCFLNLSQCEEDRVSVCGDDNGQHGQEFSGISIKIPEIFIDGESGKAWRFRFKWWLTRHFRSSILKLDMASGDMKLLTCKAAAASHIYGRHFKYVLKTIEHVEKENDMEMYSLLQTHVLNSIGFSVIESDFSKFCRLDVFKRNSYTFY